MFKQTLTAFHKGCSTLLAKSLEKCLLKCSLERYFSSVTEKIVSQSTAKNFLKLIQILFSENRRSADDRVEILAQNEAFSLEKTTIFE